MGKRVTAQEKVARDAEVVADRARGLSWPRIAERHGLTERQCRNVFRDYITQASVARDCDPLAAAEEALLAIDAVVEDATILLEQSVNPSVKAAALKTRLAALSERFVLQQLLGYLPRDLGVLEYQADARKVLRALMGVLDQHGIPDRVLREVEEAILEPVSARNGKPRISAL